MRCTPARKCDDPECTCFRLWSIEMDLAAEQTAHLSNEELRIMALEAWRDGN